MSTKPHAKAAIFDIDGTILDSMGVWETIDQQIFNHLQIPMPVNYAKSIAGMQFHEIVQYTKQQFNIPLSNEELAQTWSHMAFDAYTNMVKPKAGAIEYLQYLRSQNVPIATATSLPKHLLSSVLQAVGCLDYFDELCCVEDVQNIEKTHPDVYQRAAKLLHVEESQCIVFEDLLIGIKALRKTSMHVWAMLDESSRDDWQEMRLIAEGCLYDFTNPPYSW
ncbi:MAG: HAD family phosphatase [Bifidobacteriaceae bacterium]|nr:HAD family phosphatase [Bifidobacteriaceae bacterium]